MSNQLVTIEQSVGGILERSKQIAEKYGIVDMDVEQHYAIQQLYKSDKSVEIAQKNPVSVENAILNLSSIGMSLNPALRHAYLVPRDGAIFLDVSYMGLMHLAQEIGSIQWGQAKIVCENDHYESQGIDKEPVHRYHAFKERGKPIGVYCTVKLPSGDFLTEEMSAEQIEQVRQTSKAKDSAYSPWKTFPDEMWRKTVVKRASKYWPKSSSRFDQAVHTINQHEGLDTEREQEKIKHVKKLAEYAGNKHTPLELFGFLEQFRDDEEYYLELFRRFPPGLKVKGKEKHKEGGGQFYDYVEIFKNGSKSQIQECLDEMTDLEIQIIEKGVQKSLKDEAIA